MARRVGPPVPSQFRQSIGTGGIRWDILGSEYAGQKGCGASSQVRKPRPPEPGLQADPPTTSRGLDTEVSVAAGRLSDHVRTLVVRTLVAHLNQAQHT
jgi:hypothetical protein